jgi:D-ribose pyranase
MKKKGVLNSELARIIAGMGHGDLLVVCDSGFPIPHHSPVADVILTVNVPRLVETLKVILEELHVEGAIIANEMEKISNPMYHEVKRALADIPLKKISHAKFKQLTRSSENISFVRTGEATKYSNVILVAGVIF